MEQKNPLHHHAKHLTIKKTTLLAIIIFSIGYMISEPNLDGFNLEEALEYINSQRDDSTSIHLTGFTLSFMANVPLLAAIIYYWLKNSEHEHDHEGHHHSFLQTLLEFITIGGPFALMGSAAYLETFGEFFDKQNLTIFEQILQITGAIISGSITGFGAFKLHSFHLHDAMEENGGGVSGFFKGLYTTFVKNIWQAQHQEQSIINKVLVVCNEVWKKYGIVSVHGFLGYFAANVFLEETGLAEKSEIFDAILKIFLPIAVMLYEGNTEARSLDSYQKDKKQPVSYSIYSRFFVTLSGIFHSIPSVTALAMIVGTTQAGPFGGSLYNTLIYLGAAGLLLYPSVYGFVATTIPGYDKAAKSLIATVRDWFGREEPRHGYLEIIDPHQHRGFLSSILSKIGFLRSPVEEPNYLIYGLEGEVSRNEI